MKTKTLIALKESITHWDRLILGVEQWVGRKHCPLCSVFNSDDIADEDSCEGCPVFKATGMKYCSDTPYDDTDCFIDCAGKVKDIKDPAWIEIAKKERDFLISLLPK